MSLLSREHATRRAELVLDAWDHVEKRGVAYPDEGRIQQEVFSCLMELRIYEVASDMDLTLFPTTVRSYVNAFVDENKYCYGERR